MFKENKTITFLWSFIKNYKLPLFMVCFTIFTGDTSMLFGANYFLQRFINEATNNILTIKMGVIIICGYLFSSNFIMFLIPLKEKIKFKAKFKIKEDIKNFIFQHSLKQSNTFFSENFVGTLNSKINDITHGVENIIEKTTDSITNFVCFAIMGVIFFVKYWVMGIVFFVCCSIYLFCFWHLSKQILKKSEKASEEESNCSGKITDCFSNILSIKIFSTQRIEKANIKKQSLNILRNRSEVEFLKGTAFMLDAIFRTTLFASIFFINYYLLIKGKTQIGNIVADMGMVTMIFWWLKYVMECIIDSVESYGKIKQAVDTLFINPEIINSENAINLLVSKAELEFKDMCFKYKDNLPYVFDKLNLKINSHQKIGLIGYSGSGKSSLISLLLRFYDVSNGSILIDNQDIQKDITQESLRKNICYVPQEPVLFHRTIKENIIYGKLNATEDEIIEASKKACCYEFILGLEKGFDTLVGERGIKLSGGQRQRIAIARAILKNSPILILDEATSALDSITEKDIQIALKNLMENKTVIAVAHRLSTLNNMDRIVVLDKGKIVEDGTKNELLDTQNGLFKKMWDMQKDGVLELGD